MLYSKTTGGFYTVEIHGKNIPGDAVEVSEAAHAALIEGQSIGQRIISDELGAPILADPLPPTVDEIRAIAKRARADAVSAIVVTTQAGNTFDGDEDSQGRMSRAIIGMNDDDVMPWVLNDNTVISATKTELREALRLSGAAQSAVWVIE